MTHDELITLLVRDHARYDTLTAVSVAVKERDEYFAMFESAHKTNAGLHLQYMEAAAERDAAREALSAIGMHLDPTEDSLQALLASFVDRGLGT